LLLPFLDKKDQFHDAWNGLSLALNAEITLALELALYAGLWVIAVLLLKRAQNLGENFTEILFSSKKDKSSL